MLCVCSTEEYETYQLFLKLKVRLFKGLGYNWVSVYTAIICQFCHVKTTIFELLCVHPVQILLKVYEHNEYLKGQFTIRGPHIRFILDVKEKATHNLSEEPTKSGKLIWKTALLRKLHIQSFELSNQVTFICVYCSFKSINLMLLYSKILPWQSSCHFPPW